MNGETYNIGDTVCVRQWDDMEREFGLSSGNINLPLLTFSPEMRDLCGQTFVVAEFERNSTPDWDIYGGLQDWALSGSMLHRRCAG